MRILRRMWKNRRHLGERLANSLRRFTSDQAIQLDLDISDTSATIRKSRNSFITINRVPPEILSLICTNLPSQENRHRASFVCRHWRRTFIQCPELWSELSLSNGEVYVKTFLERAKGTPLDIVVDHGVPVETVALLSSLTKQIRSLDFLSCKWAEIQRFSEVVSGSLPLLYALTIDFMVGGGLDNVESTPPTLPLFSNAVNLKALHFHSTWAYSPFILHLVFPNLVSFNFSTEHWREFPALPLFDFLEGSPVLQTVKVQVPVNISFEGVPEERVVSLPSVENFTLIMNDGESGYKMAVHIRCPSARVTSIVHKPRVAMFLEEIFPTPVSWNAIIRQYTTSPPEEATLEIRPDYTPLICKLVFESFDSTRINLSFEVPVDSGEFVVPDIEPLIPKISAQAIQTIRNHPHLANIKRLHICNDFRSSGLIPDTASPVRQLINSMGFLDEMSIYQCDPIPYLRLIPEDGNEGPAVFPSVKELTISHPINLFDCQASIVGLAKSQHSRGIPFERVVIRGAMVVEGMEEALTPWVGSVKYYREPAQLGPI